MSAGYIKGKSEKNAKVWRELTPVSYTHLDVYKRQGPDPSPEGQKS